jgi:hypothetical protein
MSLTHTADRETGARHAARVPPASPAQPPRAAPGELARVAAAVAASPALWRPLVRFTAARRWYHKIELPDCGYELWLLSWLPGQHTGFHDHGGAAGAFAIAEGELVERTGAPGARAVRARALTAGAARSFGAAHLHDVRNAAGVPAVSVHAYAPALAVMRRYEMTAAGLEHTGTEAAGSGW